ncbi:S8 family peptidase [Thalassotalea hakodatensis]|uniref:S8 family peptidase n=1 Tax=Thalassotalea hakodatensis TaxID=3030492 RepID=UPI002573F41A|nr:S8 family serine peptidase [Thalassotalea hakodatensis]
MRFILFVTLIIFNFDIIAETKGKKQNIEVEPKNSIYLKSNHKKRYLIELHDDFSVNSDTRVLTSAQSRSNKRIEQQNKILRDTKDPLPKFNVISRLTKSTNTIIANLDQNELSKVKAHSKVRSVYPSLNLKPIPVQEHNQKILSKNKLATPDNTNQGEGITIAIIDTGIDYTHPALGGCLGTSCKVIGGYDFINDSNDPMPKETDSHGTLVAGIIVAEGEVKGVAPKASLLSYNVCSHYCPDHLMIKAIEASMDPNGDGNIDDAVDIINISLGSEEEINNPEHPLLRAIDKAIAANILVVVGAGNDGGKNFTLGNISAHDNVITVAASEGESHIANFSSKGMSEQSGYAKPDISAAGVNIQTTGLNGSYTTASGTSLAAPVVSGYSALLLKDKPNLKPNEVKAILMGTAIDLDEDYSAQGMGVINYANAQQIDFLVDESVFNLGWYEDITELNQLKALKVTNSSNDRQRFDISVIKNNENPIVYTPSLKSIELLPGESKSIEIEIELPIDLAVKPIEHPTYIAKILIKGNSSELLIPIAITNVNRVVLNVEELNSEEILDSYQFTLSILEKSKGLIENIWFNNNDITQKTFVLPEGEYRIILNALGGFTSKAYIFDKYSLNNNTKLTYQIDESLKKVNFDLKDQFGRKLDLNGALPPWLQIHINAMHSDHAGKWSSILGAYPEQPPLELYMNQPTDDVFYDFQIRKRDDSFNYHNEILIDHRFDKYSINGDELLFSNDVNNIRMLNFSYAMKDDKENQFINPTFWRYEEYPLNNLNGTGSSILMPENSETTFSMMSLSPSPDFSFFANSKAYTNSDESSYAYFHESDGVYKSAEYYFDSQGDLIVFDAQNTNHSEKKIEMNDAFYDFKLGYDLPVFRARIIDNDGIFILSHKFANSTAYFSDDLMTYYKGDVSYYIDGNEGKSKNRDVYIKSAGGINLWEIKSIELPQETEQIELQFNSYSIEDTLVSINTILNYDLNAVDKSPPMIKAFSISTLGSSHNYLANGNGKISVKFDDDSSIISNIISIRFSGTEQWVELASTSNSLNEAYLTDLEYGAYDIQLIATDSYNNKIEYTAVPAFIAEEGCRYDADCNGRWDELELGIIDSDDDGVEDSSDAFPYDISETVDTDSDGIGNNADTDDDGDGVDDSADAFPLDASESVDTDSDGIGNNADTDDDGDGVDDSADAFPLDASESVDTDSDGIGNNADTDDDGDGVDDSADAFPLDASESVDTDSDGIGNNTDTDDDGDGVDDSADAYPLDSSRSSNSSTTNNSTSSDSSGGGGSMHILLFLLFSITLVKFRSRNTFKIN